MDSFTGLIQVTRTRSMDIRNLALSAGSVKSSNLTLPSHLSSLGLSPGGLAGIISSIWNSLSSLKGKLLLISSPQRGILFSLKHPLTVPTYAWAVRCHFLYAPVGQWRCACSSSSALSSYPRPYTLWAPSISSMCELHVLLSMWFDINIQYLFVEHN